MRQTMQPDDPGVEMVQVPRNVAEWATHWYERCETGRRVTKAVAKWTLIFFGAVGTIAYGTTQIIQAVSALKGH